MSGFVLLRLINTLCYRLRKNITDERGEEQTIGETQALLEHDDLIEQAESLERALVQDLLLRVEAYNDRELRVNGGRQDDRAVQDGAEQIGRRSDGDLILTNGSTPGAHIVPASESAESDDSTQNHLLSEDEAVGRPADIHNGGLEGRDPSPETVTSQVPGNSAPQHEQRPCSVETSNASKRDLLSPLLMNYKNIRDQTLRELYPGDTIHICEYLKDDKISPRHERQTTYEVIETGPYGNVQSRHDTTYFASQHPAALDNARPVKRRPANGKPFCDFTPALLGANSFFRQLASTYLYGRNFRFQCSARGVQAFLTEVKRYVRYMTEVELFWHFRAEHRVIGSNAEEWHDMLCYMRHNVCIPRIHVHIGHHFWAIARWTEGPQAVIGQRRLRDDGKNFAPFLSDIVKFAAPAERWKYHDNPKTRCTEGTLVQISIEGTMSEEEVEFVEQLNEHVLSVGLWRVLFSPMRMGVPRGRKIPYTRTDGERAPVKTPRWENSDDSDGW